MSLPTFEEIRKIQNPTHKVQDFWLEHLYRKIDIPITWLCIVLHIDTKVVTVIGAVLDFVAGYLVLQKEFLLAAILLQVGILLDGVDGELARWRNWKLNLKNPPKIGGYMDKILGVPGFAFTVMTIGLVHNALWLAFAAATALFMVNFASSIGKVMFPDAAKIGSIAEARQSKLGKFLKPFEFGMSLQRLTITLAAINFYPILFLWIFAIVGNFYWLVRLWFYRKM